MCAHCPPRREDIARGLSEPLSLLFSTENGPLYSLSTAQPSKLSNAMRRRTGVNVFSQSVRIFCYNLCDAQEIISRSEISYLFLRVVNIASVLLKKLPYGPLCHLPTDEKEPKTETENWICLDIFFSQMQFLRLPETHIVWNSTIFGSSRQVLS